MICSSERLELKKGSDPDWMHNFQGSIEQIIIDGIQTTNLIVVCHSSQGEVEEGKTLSPTFSYSYSDLVMLNKIFQGF